MPPFKTYFIIAINIFKDQPFFGQGTRSFKKLSCEKNMKLINTVVLLIHIIIIYKLYQKTDSLDFYSYLYHFYIFH